MDREKQIEFLQNSPERMRSDALSWIRDPRVQETMKKNREHAKRLKSDLNSPPRTKAVC